MVAAQILQRPTAVWALLMSVSLLLTCSWYLGEFSLQDIASVFTQQLQLQTLSQQTASENSTDVHVLTTRKIFREDVESQTEAYSAPVNGCLEGVVTVQAGGRLGNLILEYASAAALAEHYHLRLAIPSAIGEPLSAIFANLSAEPLSRLLQEPPCRGQNLTEEKVLDDRWEKPPKAANTDQSVQWLLSRRLPVILRRWIILAYSIAPSLEFIRQEFRFRTELQSAANKKLEEITAETAHKIGCTQSQVCTVGVHVRRTDYWSFLNRRYHLQQEAGPDYYQRAVAAMLADLHSECAAVAFVVTSDDNQWCQQYLMPSLTRNISSGSVASVGFLMSSESPVEDLCLLSSCQHLIMAYGTFGLSAAILSGGRTIMYDTDKHGTTERPPVQTMALLVPHWRLIP